MTAGARPCAFCGAPASSSVGGRLTPDQAAANEAWARSFTHEFHTGHCPHLVLPPKPACSSCAAVHEVMSS